MLSSNFVNKVLQRIEKLDIHNLKDFIYQLSEERIFFETIFESMIEGVMVLSEGHHVRYMNKQARIMLGIRESQLQEKNFFDLLENEREKKIFSSFLSKIQTEKRKQRQEITLVYPVSRTIQISFYPLVHEGEVSGTVFLFLDISQQKEEAFKLKQAESLAALTTLAGGVAHEIKNPLGALDIHVQLLDRLSESLESDSKKEHQKLIHVIQEEIERLNNIVRDFLFSIRPIELHPEPTSIFDFFESMVEFLRPDFEVRGITVSFIGNRDIPTLLVDPRYLYHIFMNVLKNSLEACERGDHIEIQIERHGQTLDIQIRDTGKGISEENLNKLFEPYFTTKDFGTGLGLTIVYKLVKEHGGSIEIDSIEKEGTNLKISIPLFEDEKPLLDYIRNLDLSQKIQNKE